jgi:hypothetical protein
MTKEEVYKACKKYGHDYVKKHMTLPASATVTDGWDKADFLRFKSQASNVVSQIELDIKGIAGKVSDAIFEELILSVGGEKA